MNDERTDVPAMGLGMHGVSREEEHLTLVPEGHETPKVDYLPCRKCGCDTRKERLMSAPAKYMGETVLNPIVQRRAI